MGHASKRHGNHFFDLIGPLLQPAFRNTKTTVDALQGVAHECQSSQPQTLGMNVRGKCQRRRVHSARSERLESVRCIADDA